MKEEEAIEHFLTCCDRDTTLLFSHRGVAYIDPDEGYAYSRLWHKAEAAPTTSH